MVLPKNTLNRLPLEVETVPEMLLFLKTKSIGKDVLAQAVAQQTLDLKNH